MKITWITWASKKYKHRCCINLVTGKQLLLKDSTLVCIQRYFTHYIHVLTLFILEKFLFCTMFKSIMTKACVLIFEF